MFQFLRGHPGRSSPELSQPDSSPAISGSSCHTPNTGLWPAHTSLLNFLEGRIPFPEAEPPEASLDVKMSEVSWLDMSCREVD